MTTGVYEIVNVQNGMRYVGSTLNLDKRKERHFSNLRGDAHTNAHLQHEWNKYGKDAFEFHIVLECSSVELHQREQERIDSYDFESLYNLSPTVGSQKGMKRSAETLAKMSAAAMGNQNALGYVHSTEAKTKISAAGKGRVHSAEAREKISATLMGNQNTLGYVHTEETRAKMSAAKMGRVFSAEHRAKLSAAQTARQQRNRQLSKASGGTSVTADRVQELANNIQLLIGAN